MRLRFIIVFIALILCTGCQPESGTLVCTMSSYPAEGITLRSIYTAKYKNNVVTKLKTVEKVISVNKENLEVYQEKIEQLYSEYQDIPYYDNQIDVENDTLIATTVIQYDKVDTEKLIEIGSGNASVIKDGKVDVNNLADLYRQNGCNCSWEG